MQSTAALIAVVRFSIAMPFTAEEHVAALQSAMRDMSEANAQCRSAGWQVAMGWKRLRELAKAKRESSQNE